MKRKQKHFLFALASAMLLSTTYQTMPVLAETTTTVNLQQYEWNWSQVSSSYLAVENNGYLRVSPQSSKEIAIEYYDNNFKSQTMQYVEAELPLFGGFYSTSDFYYMVFGQENLEEHDDVEVIRVIKYDKNWNRIAAASVYGANTRIPFDAGNLRMADYGGYLYIRTAHEMYTSEDGLNHQSNLTIEVRESDMKVVDSFYEVMNSSVGYISHSFNQFILVDDNANLVALDHGDAYPRGAFLGKYDTKAGNEIFCSGYDCYDGFNVLEYEGNVGDNYTGATIGGLADSDTCYLTVGSSVAQDKNYKEYETQNIYITATKKDSFSKESTVFSWVTN